MWFESAWDLQMGSHHETCLGTNWPLRCLRSLERSGWVFGGNCVVNGKLWQVMASYYPNPQIVINCNGNPNVSHLSHLIILPHLVNSLPGVGPPSMLFTSFLAVGNCGCSSPNVVFQCILQGLIHPQISYIYNLTSLIEPCCCPRKVCKVCVAHLIATQMFSLWWWFTWDVYLKKKTCGYSQIL